MNIVIFEIKKPYPITKNQLKSFAQAYARYYEEYDDSWLIVIPEKVLCEGKAEFLINSDDHYIRLEKLNNFAMNRLISNFENEHPELSLIMMGAGNESKLIKLRKKEK